MISAQQGDASEQSVGPDPSEAMCINESQLDVHTERVDDIPLLFGIQKQLGIRQVLDEVIEVHGNRGGLSIGWLTTTWLSYILSEADHRMCEVEAWAASHRVTLTSLLPCEFCEKDFTDDRLASVLRYLSDDDTWQKIEVELGRKLLNVYDLTNEPLRLDSTTVCAYHQTDGNDLFRFGHSKDHRPDLPQFKVMLATLDPLGCPLATLTVAGNEADDGLYLPAVDSARKIVGCGGRLYIGDAKLASLNNRAAIDKSSDYYLTPLPMTGEIPELKVRLLNEFHAKKHPVETVSQSPTNPGRSSSSVPKALGFEVLRMQVRKIDDEPHRWKERVLALYSPSLARTHRSALTARMARAEKELSALRRPPKRGRRRYETEAELTEKVLAIISTHRVEGLFKIEYQKEESLRYVRAYKQNSPRYEGGHRYLIRFERNWQAIATERKRMGWRLYATNAPTTKLKLGKAIEVYRQSPTIERNFGRLKGRCLGIRPLYVQRQDHVIGLVRLLSLALRVLTTAEYTVRLRLLRLGKSLAGLYAGNPKRRTLHPTTEKLLTAFWGITVTVISFPSGFKQHLTPLSPLQLKILRLLGISKTIYTRLAVPFGSSQSKQDPLSGFARRGEFSFR